MTYDDQYSDPYASPWNTFTLKAQGFLRKYGIPYIHGCVWDKECRSFYLRRISVHTKNAMYWVDLPGYYEDITGDEPTEEIIEVGGKKVPVHMANVGKFWHKMYFGKSLDKRS